MRPELENTALNLGAQLVFQLHALCKLFVIKYFRNFNEDQDEVEVKYVANPTHGNERFAPQRDLANTVL